MHTKNHLSSGDSITSSKLRFAALLTSLILVAEVVGGLLSNSLALLSDAGHVFMDFVSLVLALFALYLAGRPVTEERTYGMHRAEVLAALANGLLLLGLSAGILYKSYERLLRPKEVEAPVMMAFAVAGLLGNLVVLLRLRGKELSDLNIRSAFLHVFSDFIASIGVVVGALIISFTGWLPVDPIISAAIAIAIFFGGLRVMREGFHILLEGVPRGMDINEIVESIRSAAPIESVHHIHVWSICSNVLALAAHIIVKGPPSSQREVIARVNKMLVEKYNIRLTTIQVDQPGEEEALLRRIGH